MKNEPARKSMSGQVVLGIVVIGMGMLFLLDNFGVVDFHHVLHFWPMVLILVGVAKLCDRSGRLLGAALLGAGIMLTLGRMGIVYVSWHTLWPLLLIALGGALVYRALAGRRFIEGVKDAPDGGDAVLDVTAILGGFERRIAVPAFRGGEVTAIMGGCVLDMRESSIDDEAVINVFAAFGGITIKVPLDWTVIVHGTPILGGFEEKTTVPANSAKRLIVKGYAIMGGVEIRN